MFDINLVAIIAATVVTMAIATVWYSPSVFGKQWMKDVGVTDEDVEAQKQGMWKRFLAASVAQFIVLYILSYFLVIADAYDSTSAIVAAVWMTILVAAVSVSAVIWEKKTLSYFFINAGYTAVTLVGGGAIIFYWPW